MSSSGVQTCADRKSTRLNSSHTLISYAVFCLKKKKQTTKDHLDNRLIPDPYDPVASTTTVTTLVCSLSFARVSRPCGTTGDRPASAACLPRAPLTGVLGYPPTGSSGC